MGFLVTRGAVARPPYCGRQDTFRSIQEPVVTRISPRDSLIGGHTLTGEYAGNRRMCTTTPPTSRMGS